MALTRTLVTLTLFISTCQSVPTSPDCFVELVKGPVEGYKMETFEGKTICAYENLPYAQAPTGKLRFKPPVAVVGVTEVYYANSTPAMCPQIESGSKRVKGDEDCLRLSIYTPKVGNCSGQTLYPVIVFIRTVAYVVGNNADANVISPFFLLDEPVVFVTVNFRLGALGFFSTGDCTLSGNWGLKDIALAIQKISLNIASFGGDPNKITVLGEGRGATLAQLLFYMPQTAGLLNNVILQSGNVVNPYAIGPLRSVTTASKKLAEIVGCPTNATSQQLQECMQKKPFKEIVKNQDAVYPNPDAHAEYAGLWTPVIEPAYAVDAVITFNPATVPACCKPEYSAVMGASAYDGGAYTAYVLDPKSGLLERLNSDRITTLINLLQLDFIFCKECLRSVAAEINEYYFQGKNITHDSEPQITAMYTDWFYFTGLRFTALGHVGTRYVYLDNATLSESFNMLRSGNLSLAPTLDDILLSYLPLATYFPNRTYSRAERTYIKFSVKSTVNFATYGNPVHGLHTDWDPVKPNGKVNYLETTIDSAVQYDDFSPDGVLFIEYLLQKYPYKADPATDYNIC